MGDTAADAILAGLGGLGFFATIQGINHASEKYENGGDAVEAVFEGCRCGRLKVLHAHWLEQQKWDITLSCRDLADLLDEPC